MHPTWTLRGLGDGLLLGALTGGVLMIPSAISESTAGGNFIWVFIGVLYGALCGMLFGFGAGLLIDVLGLIGAGERWAVAGVMVAAVAVTVRGNRASKKSPGQCRGLSLLEKSK